MKEDPTPVGVVGAGYWGKNIVRNFDALGALAVICERNEERLQEFGDKYPQARLYSDFEDVLSDDDVPAVAISTPAETHGQLVRLALEADKEVFVEKPLCLSVSEGEELLELAELREKTLMVGHLLWYHPAILKLKEVVDRGELGRIQYVYSNRLNLGKIRQSENILWSFAPHDISVILGLLDEMPSEVWAKGGNYLHENVADVTVSHLSFPSGVKAHIFVSWLHPFKEQKLVIVGDDGMVVFDDLAEENKLLRYPHSIEWESRAPVARKALAEPIPLEMSEPLYHECRHFLECVATGSTPRTDGREALRVLNVLAACQEHLQEGPMTERDRGSLRAVST